MTLPLSPDEATRLLRFHASPDDGSFLAMLRPYHGVVDELILKDVTDALEASAPLLRRDAPPRELVAAIWAISHFGRAWALAPDGMLQRNRLIEDADVAMLAAFLDAFDLRVLELLEAASED